MSCVKACPRGVITAVPYEKTTLVPCLSTAKGAVTTRSCSAGCIGCGLCKKICPEGAISVVNGLAVIDYDKCISCGLCATVCPKKIIVDLNEAPPSEALANATK